MVDFLAIQYAGGLRNENPLLIVAALLKYELPFRLGELFGIGGAAMLFAATNVMVHTVFKQNKWIAYAANFFCGVMALWLAWLFKSVVLNRQEYEIDRQVDGQIERQRVSRKIYAWRRDD